MNLSKALRELLKQNPNITGQEACALLSECNANTVKSTLSRMRYYHGDDNERIDELTKRVDALEAIIRLMVSK